jgi:hypothetical protein
MKTAVEWLEDCLREQYPNGKFVWNTRADIEALFKRAKEMEKQQIETAYEQGFFDERNGKSPDEEKFYKETFKK